MKKIFISTLITLLVLCLGCFYLPYNIPKHRVPDKQTLEAIKADVTSKEDILMMLGEPDRVRNDERLFIYWWQVEHGSVGSPLFLPTMPFSFAIMHIRSLHVEFNENNIVKNFEIRMFDEFGEDSEYISK